VIYVTTIDIQAVRGAADAASAHGWRYHRDIITTAPVYTFAGLPFEGGQRRVRVPVAGVDVLAVPTLTRIRVRPTSTLRTAVVRVSC
jgi:hypothetical protein